MYCINYTSAYVWATAGSCPSPTARSGYEDCTAETPLADTMIIQSNTFCSSSKDCFWEHEMLHVLEIHKFSIESKESSCYT